MIRRPPRSTRTDTLFPYTPLFRSQGACFAWAGILPLRVSWAPGGERHQASLAAGLGEAAGLPPRRHAVHRRLDPDLEDLRRLVLAVELRSEERRVGKEGVSKCRSRWEP